MTKKNAIMVVVGAGVGVGGWMAPPCQQHTCHGLAVALAAVVAGDVLLAWQAIVDTFHALKECEEWMERGLSVKDLRTFCISKGHPFFFTSSGRLLLTEAVFSRWLRY